MKSFFSGRSKSQHKASWFPDSSQHPDLPLSPRNKSSANASRRDGSLPQHRASVKGTNNVAGTADRRSIALLPAPTSPTASYPYSPDDIQSIASSGLSRSQTLLRREQAGVNNSIVDHAYHDPNHVTRPAHASTDSADVSPQAHWSSTSAHLPSPSEQSSPYIPSPTFTSAPAPQTPTNVPMSTYAASNTPGKTSSDSGQPAALDRWSQRRLQRLNTEQGFREQRQGGQGILSPPPPGVGSEQQSPYQPQQQPVSQYTNASAQPHAESLQHHQTQSHPAAQQGAYQTSRTAQTQQPTNVGLAIQTQATSASSRPSQFSSQEPQSHVSQHSPSGNNSHYASDNRPPLSQSRSFSQQSEDSSMSNSGTATVPAVKAVRNGNNRQSVHNGMQSTREGSVSTQGAQMAAFNTSVVPPNSQGQPYKSNNASQPQQQQQGDIGRGTPQPLQIADEMTDEEVVQLVKDHKELREKYTKVKKYYFEKEDQVKQLQNSLAHQRLSQSRTSLDDSEYTTRFNRLDGLIAQLAFSIRKSWKSMPSWLAGSINKDAVQTGKQEMTAAGRAFISNWLVEEVFDKYFHPDLDPQLSEQLKTVQRNIRRYAPVAQTTEEEEYLTSKVVNWRLATLEGLQEALRSAQCPENRQRLTDMLKEALCQALAVHLQDPPPSDLEGGVHMIIELVVSIAIHLPLESRDVVIEYFPPGYSIMTDQMKLESGIPPLAIAVAEDPAERASLKSATSDVTDMAENNNAEHSSRKRSMLSALTGSKPKVPGKHSHNGAGGSSSSLHRPESAQGDRDMPPRVRMAAGIGISVRGRSVLVKAPVFSV